LGGKLKILFVGEPFFGKDSKELRKNDDVWEIGVFACGRVFSEYPNIVDEQTFIKEMLKLGVGKEKLKEVMEYNSNFDDFATVEKINNNVCMPDTKKRKTNCQVPQNL